MSYIVSEIISEVDILKLIFWCKKNGIPRFRGRLASLLGGTCPHRQPPHPHPHLHTPLGYKGAWINAVMLYHTIQSLPNLHWPVFRTSAFRPKQTINHWVIFRCSHLEKCHSPWSTTTLSLVNNNSLLGQQQPSLWSITTLSLVNRKSLLGLLASPRWQWWAVCLWCSVGGCQGNGTTWSITIVSQTPNT